ncbi:OmpA family protein [Flavobacterium sp. RHBU_24]|uniref:OmpA family protein n=1 Tax=Flavobacterium sp. RHBU_24 TaxID=3391185 RepID=UPI00398568FA
MKKHYYIAALFFCITSMMGQSVLRKAEVHYRDFAYTEAAKEYEQYLEGEKNPKTEILMHAAEANFHIGNTGAASRYFDQAYAQQPDAFTQPYLNLYIQALKGEEHYAEADAILWKKYAGNPEVLEKLQKQKSHLDSLTALGIKYKLDNLAINTDKADFGATFYGKKVVFASARDTVRDGAKTYSWNAQPYLSLYVADRNADGSFGKEKEFLKNAQTDYHNAQAAFSPDLKTVYVSVNNVSKQGRLQNSDKGTNNIQLVYGQVQGERLNKKTIAAFNSNEFSTGQPAVSPDGKWLYFVSDMPGGYGATDIYYCEIYSDGKLGTPVNAGPTVNTDGREMFPYLKGDVLYFSSDGHYGLGGLDIFRSTVTADKQFSLPQNLGKPLNSNRDDFAFALAEDGKSGYLSSNRAGGKGDDDIYYFTEEEKACEKIITGIITDKKSGQPIEGVEVTITVGEKEFTEVTKADGSYTITISCDSIPVVTAKKDGFATGEPDKDGNINLDAYTDLVKKGEGGAEMIDINPIYFDFDQYYITPQAASELDKVVYVMQQFPNVSIKIESHTDSRGKDDYNLRLSDDRAKSTYSYITSKGIDPKRIESVKGFGESRLLNKCSNGIQCTDEEHQLNRRSNFIIVKK